jgi:hypothetical protein
MMTNQHHRRAAKVVAEFKEIIGESVCSEISDAHFDDLTLLIRDAITDELLSAVDLIENAVKKIRSDTDLLELGI